MSGKELPPSRLQEKHDCEWNVEFYLISVLVIQSQVQLANVRDEYLRICFGFRRNDADERKIREKEKNFTAWW